MPRQAVPFVLTKGTKSNKREPFRLGSLLTLSQTTKGSAAFGNRAYLSLILMLIMYAFVFMLIIETSSEHQTKLVALFDKDIVFNTLSSSVIKDRTAFCVHIITESLC